MHEGEVTALIAKASALMERFDRRCAAIEQRQQALAQELQHLTQRLPAVIGQSAETTLQSLPGRIIEQVGRGLDKPVDGYEQRLRTAGQQIGDGAHGLARQILRAEQLHRQLVWKTLGATLGCLLLLLAGGAWLSMHYRGVIVENQLDAARAEALNNADVVICDQQLCASVDIAGVRYGDKQQYLPVKPR